MSGVFMQEIESLFGAILDLAISPIVSRLSEEAGQFIELKVIALCADQMIERLKYFEDGITTDGVTAYGEVRILLKASGYPCGFEVEAIFKELSPETGFSGFSMRGKVKLEDGKPSVKLTAHSNRYNVWEWSREFRSMFP